MSLNADLMFEKAEITQDLIDRLGLPQNVWSLVLIDTMPEKAAVPKDSGFF